MADIPKLLAQATLVSGINTLYTTPSSTTTLIRYISLTIASGTIPSGLYVDIKAGDSGSEKYWRKNMVFSETTPTIEYTGTPFILEASDVIKFITNYSGIVDVLITGLEVTS